MTIDLNLFLFSPSELIKHVVDCARVVVPQDDLASQAVFERVSGEKVSEWDYRIAFGVLKERESRVLRDIILCVASEYNSMHRELSKTHPEFTQRAWDIYKKLGVSFRSPVFNSMFKTECDLDFARFYIRGQLRACGDKFGKIIFEDWGGVEMIKYDSDFLFGVGQYTFRDNKGHKVNNIWDLRQKKLPVFAYAKEL